MGKESSNSNFLNGLHSVLVFGVLIKRGLRAERHSALGAFELAGNFASCWLHHSRSGGDECSEYCDTDTS
jgi:hypothetical protein